MRVEYPKLPVMGSLNHFYTQEIKPTHFMSNFKPLPSFLVQDETVTNSGDVVRLIRGIVWKQTFTLIGLTEQDAVAGVMQFSQLEPRNPEDVLVAYALRCRAKKLIIVSVSGGEVSKPSQQDNVNYMKLKDAALTVNIVILDMILTWGDVFFSYANNEMI